MVRVADYPRGATFGPRTLLDHEFVWMLRGSAVWTVRRPDPDGLALREESHRLWPGTVALARAGTVDSYRWDPDQASTHAYVHFRLSVPPGTPWPAVRTLSALPVLDSICGYLLRLAAVESAATRHRSDELVRLLLDVFLAGPLDDPYPRLGPSLAAVVDHVREVWAADGMRIVGVPELATAARVSSGHLFRLFREQYGCGPARAFELVRLARAATSLQRSNATLAEGARQTGFANPYHFSRRFAAGYGSPPGGFRGSRLTPDPLAPVREAGLLPLAHALLTYLPDPAGWSP